MALYPPDSLIAGQYQVGSRPLMGGMGIVYLCYDHGANRPVALKTFRPEFLPDRAARDRFLREGDTWMKLERHPHVVHAYGVERVGDGTEVYLVLELIAKEEGRQDASLRSWLKLGQPMPPEQAILFAMQVIRGMQFASERIPGFVHRDLKPENLLVGSDKLTNAPINRLRVTDLGLASVVTDPREIAGTPLYMAPEQWSGEAVSVATDMYALGCIVFEMLAGESAVNGGSLSALERSHNSEKRKTLAETVPIELRRWAEWCVRVPPAERFTSWLEAEHALDEVYRSVTGVPLPNAEAAGELGRVERIVTGAAHTAMGHSYLDIGKPEVALRYFEQARLAGAREHEPRLEAVSLNGLGLASARLNKLDEAIKYYDHGLEIEREMNDRVGELAILVNLGVAIGRMGYISGAIQYYEQSLSLSRQVGDRQAEGTTLNNIGLAYVSLDKLPAAINSFEEAVVIAREMDDRRGETNALGGLGISYKKLDQLERAIEFDELALAIAHEIGDRHGEMNHLGNLASVYLQLGKFERTIEYLKEVLEITRETGDRISEAGALGDMGQAYLNLRDMPNAFSCLEKAATIHHELGDASREALDLYKLALGYGMEADIKSALPLAVRAYELFSRNNDPRTLEVGRYVATLEGPGGSYDRTLEMIRDQMGPFIAAVVAATEGNEKARMAVEETFEDYAKGGVFIAEPIKRLWQGERDDSKLTQELDQIDAFIIREILTRLK